MTSSHSYDGVIFDMDGTLIEQRIDFAAIRSALGIAPDQPLLETVLAMPPAEKQQAEAFLRDHELGAAGGANLLPGVVETLAAVRQAGLKTALLTRNMREAVALVLARFDLGAFDHIRTRDDGVIKPEPDGVLAVCEALALAPARTVCVGDFEYDITAANAAGTLSILLTPPDDLPAWADTADHVIHRLDELKPILRIV